MSTDETMAPPRSAGEVEMVEPEVVRQLRELSGLGWGAKRIAASWGSRETRCGGTCAGAMPRRCRCVREHGGSMVTHARKRGSSSRRRPKAMRSWWRSSWRAASRRACGPCSGCAGRASAAAEPPQVATVRFETAPGHQMQIDFGEKWVWIGGERVEGAPARRGAGLLAADLRARVPERASRTTGARGSLPPFGTSAACRRTCWATTRASLVLGATAGTRRPFIRRSRRSAGTGACARVACGPYRARTKGKTESGVKYVKRNALAGRVFDELRGARGASARVDASRPTSASTGPRTSGRCERFERDERRRCARCPRDLCRVASGDSPSRRQRLARRRRHGPLQRAAPARARPASRCSSVRTTCASSTERARREHRRVDEPHERRRSTRRTSTGLWRQPRVAVEHATEPRRAPSAVPRASTPTSSGRWS